MLEKTLVTFHENVLGQFMYFSADTRDVLVGMYA